MIELILNVHEHRPKRHLSFMYSTVNWQTKQPYQMNGVLLYLHIWPSLIFGLFIYKFISNVILSWQLTQVSKLCISDYMRHLCVKDKQHFRFVIRLCKLTHISHLSVEFKMNNYFIIQRSAVSVVTAHLFPSI